MPWKQLSSWFSARDSAVLAQPLPLTLVTLRRAKPADRAAIACVPKQRLKR